MNIVIDINCLDIVYFTASILVLISWVLIESINVVCVCLTIYMGEFIWKTLIWVYLYYTLEPKPKKEFLFIFRCKWIYRFTSPYC